MSGPLSGHQHFQVWPHDAIEANRLRDSIGFVQVKTSAPPRFDESFHRDVQSHLASESKAVDNRSSDAVDPHHAAFDAMLFDSETEQRGGNPCHADGRVRNRWDACPARNGEPHLSRQLRPEVVKEKGRREARDAGGDDHLHRRVEGVQPGRRAARPRAPDGGPLGPQVHVGRRPGR